MGMQFFGNGVGHKSKCVATDHFWDDHDHSDLDINGQHDSVNNLIDYKDEVDASVAEGSKLNGDDDYGYGNPLNELEDVVTDNLEDNSSSKEDGAMEGGS